MIMRERAALLWPVKKFGHGGHAGTEAEPAPLKQKSSDFHPEL
jgi:hypothetical protein